MKRTYLKNSKSLKMKDYFRDFMAKVVWLLNIVFFAYIAFSPVFGLNETNASSIANSSFLGNPALDIFVLAFFVTLVTTLITKHTTPQDEIKKLKKDLKELQKKMKKLDKEDIESMKRIQKEILEINGELFKKNMNLKNMLITSLPLILLISWVRAHYSVYGEFLNLGFTKFGWLGTYIFSSIICSILWKKLLKVE